jgi:hypothetical protein
VPLRSIMADALAVRCRNLDRVGCSTGLYLPVSAMPLCLAALPLRAAAVAWRAAFALPVRALLFLAGSLPGATSALPCAPPYGSSLQHLLLFSAIHGLALLCSPYRTLGVRVHRMLAPVPLQTARRRLAARTAALQPFYPTRMLRAFPGGSLSAVWADELCGWMRRFFSPLPSPTDIYAGVPNAWN